MSRWDDAVGLMWADAVKDRGVGERILNLSMKSDWVALTELPRLPTRGRICVDVETKDPDLAAEGPGVRRPGNYIIGLAIGIDNGSRWYFPVRHEAGGNMDEEQVKAWARFSLNNFEGEIVGANLSYDLDWLAEWGITFPKVKAFHDIQICEPLLDEWRLRYNLDALSMDYLGEGKEQGLLDQVALVNGWNSERLLKSNLWRLPASYVGPYAEGDVDRPLRILPIQLQRLNDEGLMPVYEIERKLIPILVAMRRRGVRVDVEKAERVRAELTVRRDVWLAEVKRLAGPQAELMQASSFAQALRERQLPIPLTPKKKEPSIKKDYLERYQGDELVNAIWQGRKLNTTINTFLDGHILGHAINGRIHCEFNQLKNDDSGTIARLSSSNPNLQNLPARDEEIAPLIRSIFIPEEGSDWARYDYSQIEYRLLVHFAVGQGAEEARELYRKDPTTDFHKYVARQMNIDPEDKMRRKRVKNVNFAKGYGARAKRLAQIMGCPENEAQDFMNQYDRDLPFAKATFEACERWMKKRGYVVTILGRKQRCSLWEPFNNYGDDIKPPLPRDEALKAYGTRIQRFMTYAAMNRKFQGSGADIMKKGMVDSWEAGINEVIGPSLLTVHDELDNDQPQTKVAREAGLELQRILEKVVELKVPMPVDYDTGKDWGACG